MGEHNNQGYTTFPARLDNIPSITERVELEIVCGLTTFGHTVAWNLRDDPHGIVVAPTVELRASTAAHTILINAARLPMGIIVADFLAHGDFAGYHPWPNVHLVGDDLHAAIRAVIYAAELTRARFTEGGVFAPILLLVNGIDHCVRMLGSGALKRSTSAIIEALRYVHQHGQEVGVHTLITVDRHLHLVDPALASVSFKAQIGRPAATDTSELLWGDPAIGNTVKAGTPGRGLISTHDGIEQIQWLYTPTPGRENTESDRRLLASLRPEPCAQHPRMVIDLPDADCITSWTQVHQAPIWKAFGRPDLDPLSPAYRPRLVLPEHLNHKRRQRTSQGER